MHDWYGAILGLLALIGFIKSIVDSIRKRAAAKRTAARSAPSAKLQPPTPPPLPVNTLHEQLVQRLAKTALVRAAVPPPPSAPAPSPVLLPPIPAASGTGPVRGMFEGPATLVRAIVAAEVLGPPKSLQEQSIWSPRHSEPSI